MAVGAIVRLAQLISGRSLWLDESFLWLNLSRRSYGELTGPLDLAQGAPIPFLLAEKLAITAFGDAEWALRLVPFLAGLAALPLAVLVARRYVAPWAVPVAVALIALAPPLIYYSAEAKQYSLDVVAALVAYLLAAALTRPTVSPPTAIVVALAGAALVWVSDPSVFMLAGIGVVLLASAARDRDAPRLRLAVCVAGAWLASFVVVYLVHIRDLGAVRTLATGDDDGASRVGIGELAHDLRQMAQLLEDALGLPSVAVALAVVMALAGAFAMRARGAGLLLALITAPLGVLLVAGVGGLYPIGDRFGLFTAPALALLIGEGLVATWRAVRPRSLAIAVAVVAGVLLGPVAMSLDTIASPVERQEVGPVVRYVAEHRRPADRIYVYQAGQYVFSYYAPRSGIATRPFVPGPGAEVPPERYWAGAYAPALASTPQVIVGHWSDDLQARLRDVDRVAGPGRVWLVFSTVRRSRDYNERSLMIQRLLVRGNVIDEVSATGASAVLMELR